MRFWLTIALALSIHFLSATASAQTGKKTLTLTSPDGGEEWVCGSVRRISWLSGEINKVNLEYSTDSGSSWIFIDSVSAALGSYQWTLPAVPTSSAIVRITDKQEPSLSDVSNKVFLITDKLVVVIGSSTAAGSGASVPDSAWVWRYRSYVKSLDPKTVVINLAIGGYTTYDLMPDGFVPPAGRPLPKQNNNITQALSYKPKAVIVNLPSNDANLGCTVNEQMNNYAAIVSMAAKNGSKIWINTTQPRNFSEAAKIKNLKDVRDSIIAVYRTNSINIFDGLATSDGRIAAAYNSGDGVHLNDKGHRFIFDKIVQANIYELMNGEDKVPPRFVPAGDTSFVTYKTDVKITLKTDESCFVKYSYSDENYADMDYQFDQGQGGFIHSVIIPSKQSEKKTIYVRGEDIFGNSNSKSVSVSFSVDTMQTPVRWNDVRYPDSKWASGPAPIGSGSSDVTKIKQTKTAYFKKTIILGNEPVPMVLFVKCLGSVVYVNGHELKRFEMPADADITYDTDPLTKVFSIKSYTMDSVALKKFHKGNNLIAVELHGNSTTPVDGFDCQMFSQKEKIIQYGSLWNFYAESSAPDEYPIGSLSAVETGKNAPSEFKLYPNYPNPFNPATILSYDLPSGGRIALEVFDALGKKVRTIEEGEKSQGHHEIKFNAAGLSSGIYLVVMRTNGFQKTQKILLLK